jgi:hypothetical protein
MIRIAVIGAGIFGSSAAIALARKGYAVDLYEKENRILAAASGLNQYRLHRGYHYPRSIETALSSKKAEVDFMREYEDAIHDTSNHYYAIASEHSLITGRDFLEFCEKCDLEYEETSLEVLDPSSVQTVVKVKEKVFDPFALKQIVQDKITDSGVRLLINQEFRKEHLDAYDIVVNCSYAHLNAALDSTRGHAREYQYELCEKPVLRLPSDFKNISIVIMDGPFTCIDPLGDTGLHVMGNVVHAIHETNIGLSPVIPEKFSHLLNKGIISHPLITNIKHFLQAASVFMPKISDADHVGSMFTIRTVLPKVEKTDERPTFVYRVDEKIINVFSGKIGNCIEAADRIVKLVGEKSSAQDQ